MDDRVFASVERLQFGLPDRRRLGCILLKGHYGQKGDESPRPEIAFFVPCEEEKKPESSEAILGLGRAFDQESVLYSAGQSISLPVSQWVGWDSNPQPTPKAVPPKAFGVRGCSTTELSVSHDCTKERWPLGDSFSPSVRARAHALTRCWAFLYWQRAQEVAQNGALSGLSRGGAPKAYVRGSPLNRRNDGHTNPGGCRPKPFLGETGLGGARTHNQRLKRALICLCNIFIYRNLEQQDLFVATLLLKLPVLQTTDFLLSSPSLFSQYMTSDHRIAGSRPCRVHA